MDSELLPTPDQIDQLDPGCISDFHAMFAELGYDLDHDGITAWLESDYDVSGAQLYTDTEICKLGSKEDTCTPEVEEDEEMDAEEEKCTVSHSNAAFMFEQCLTWLEHPTSTTQCYLENYILLQM